MHKHFKNNKGFSVIEVLLVLAIVSVLIGYSMINGISAQRRNTFSGTIDTLISDMKQQQLKAMVGDSEGRSTADSYGIYFNQNQSTYVLFHGTTYIPNPSDNSNFIVNLDENVQIVAVPAASSLIFSQASGEVSGFVQGSNTITLRDTTNGQQNTVTFNKYGVITQIN